MDSSNNNVWINQHASNQFPGSSRYTNVFNHQAGYTVQEPGSNQYGRFGQYPVHQHNPFPSPYLSHIMRERDTIQREIEKEQIRKQIIVSEITHRRLEAEIRRRLMMFEGELARQRERNTLLLGLLPVSNPMEAYARPRESNTLLLGLPPVSSPMEGDLGRQRGSNNTLLLGLPPVSCPMEGDLGWQRESSNALLLGLPPASGPMEGTIAEGRPVRVAFSPDKKEKLNAVSSESHRVKTLPFQRGAGDLKISDVKHVNVTKGKEEKKVVLLAKPYTNISGSKRKAVPVAFAKLNKKAKKGWSCDLCQVKVASESTLHMHLFGKKHKKKEESLQAQITGTVGTLPRTPVSNNNTVENATDTLLLNKPQDLRTKNDDFLANHKPSNLNKEVERVQNVGRKKTIYTFWCNMCKVGAMTKNNMDAHEKGKKHIKSMKGVKKCETC